MITLVGHGYVGSAIGKCLSSKSILFRWISHNEFPLAAIDGPVINAAGFTGYPNVDECETRRWDCWEANVSWPLRLQETVNSRGHYKCIHIGSGCIYTGSNVKEYSRPNFVESYYSTCKAAGQMLLEKSLGSSGYLLRIRMPFGPVPHPRNLLSKLAAYPVLVDSENSISCIEDVAEVVCWFLSNNAPAGVYNVVNPGPIATSKIVYLMKFEQKKWAQMPEILAHRSICTLDSYKLSKVLGNSIIPSTQDRIQEFADRGLTTETWAAAR